MTAYLRAHRPARSQFRSPRRLFHSPLPGRLTGCTVLHTAESFLDETGADTGAEGVAAYMLTRTTPGSYHDIVDSDSVVQLVEYGDEAYQDGTGSNPWALSISFACRTTDWTGMGAGRRAAFLANGARAFAGQQAWLAEHGHFLTPLRRISRAQSESGLPGFVTHGDRDPGRRSDPGAAFPWAEWFTACAEATGTHQPAPTPEPVEDLDMAALDIIRTTDGATYAAGPGIFRQVGGKTWDLLKRHGYEDPSTTVNAAQRDALRTVYLSADKAVQAAIEDSTEAVLETVLALPAATVDALRDRLVGSADGARTSVEG